MLRAPYWILAELESSWAPSITKAETRDKFQSRSLGPATGKRGRARLASAGMDDRDEAAQLFPGGLDARSAGQHVLAARLHRQQLHGGLAWAPDVKPVVSDGADLPFACATPYSVPAGSASSQPMCRPQAVHAVQAVPMMQAAAPVSALGGMPPGATQRVLAVMHPVAPHLPVHMGGAAASPLVMPSAAPAAPCVPVCLGGAASALQPPHAAAALPFPRAQQEPAVQAQPVRFMQQAQMQHMQQVQAQPAPRPPGGLPGCGAAISLPPLPPVAADVHASQCAGATVGGDGSFQQQVEPQLQRMQMDGHGQGLTPGGGPPGQPQGRPLPVPAPASVPMAADSTKKVRPDVVRTASEITGGCPPDVDSSGLPVGPISSDKKETLLLAVQANAFSIGFKAYTYGAVSASKARLSGDLAPNAHGLQKRFACTTCNTLLQKAKDAFREQHGDAIAFGQAYGEDKGLVWNSTYELADDGAWYLCNANLKHYEDHALCTDAPAMRAEGQFIPLELMEMAERLARYGSKPGDINRILEQTAMDEWLTG